MFKKNFYAVCAIIAGICMLFLYLNTIFDLQHRFNEGWVIGLFLFIVYLFFGALALQQVIKISLKNLLFRFLALMLLIIAIYLTFELTLSLIVSFWDWKWANDVMNFLGRFYQNEDRVITYVIYSFFVIIGILGSVLLVKREWLPGASLLAISLANFLPLILFSWLEIDFSNDETGSLVLSGLSEILSIAAWFAIAWWLKKQDLMALPMEPVEVA